MVLLLRAPSAEKHMAIEASRSAGRFTMLSVVPWPQPTQGYGFQASFQPVIICHDAGRDSLVGYVLPFNDIMSHFQGADMENIMQLSQWWIQTYGKRSKARSVMQERAEIALLFQVAPPRLALPLSTGVKLTPTSTPLPFNCCRRSSSQTTKVKSPGRHWHFVAIDISISTAKTLA